MGIKYATCDLQYTDMLHGQTWCMGFPPNLAIKQQYCMYKYLIHYGLSILEDTALFPHPKVWQNDLQE